MISKLADVGLACLVPHNVTDSSSQFRDTNPVGTYSYIDPEYQRTGVFTPKSDVYAFGIVILQLLTGKGPIGLTACIENAIEKNILGEMLDPMAGNWPIDVATEMARLALKCSELKRRDRPDLNTILPKLDKLRTFVDNYLVQVVWNKKTVSEGERGIIPSFFLCPLSKVCRTTPAQPRF
jgi:nucleoredoxin